MRYKFFDPLFYANVWLLIGSREEFNEELDNSIHETDQALTIQMTNGDVTRFYVWLKNCSRYYNMVHETLHLAHRILNHASIDITNDNIELVAYYQNYWVRKFWHKMSKFIKEK